jgi:acyl-CoA synthetase (AMP-forming)/AMP-acid ligase II
MLISDILSYSAQRSPDKVALRYRESSLTYSQLYERVLRLASALQQVGAPGDRVAILAENCPEYLECCYGVPAAGMVLTFLNYRLAPREMAYILNDAEATVIITEPSYLPTVEGIRAEIPFIREVILIGDEMPDTRNYESLLRQGSPDGPVAWPSDGDLAWLMYTSGTTGLPKGAMFSHKNVVFSVLNSAIEFDHRSNEICIFNFPMYHVATYYILIWQLRTFEVVLLKAFDPKEWFATVERRHISYSIVAATMLVMLLNDPTIDDYDLSTLRGMLYGAAPMPAELLRQAMKRWPQVGFNTVFGMTELAGNAFYMSPADHVYALEHDTALLLACGRQLPLSAARVVDEVMRDVALGEIGELIIRGDQVTSGYWHDKAHTEEALAGGWLHTGDLARWDENGLLYIVGRIKDMIISGGENVYSREVEDVLFEHPGVFEAAVVGMPDEQWGEVVVAVVHRKPNSIASEDELIAFCRERLASYKKPRRVVFVEELPKNASGKILKFRLRSALQEGSLPLV